MADPQEVIAMNEAGLSPKAIAAEVGLSEGTVRKILKDAGVSFSGNVKKLPEEAIAQAYVDDASVPDILQDFGISYTKLYEVLANQGVPTRRKAAEKGRVNQLEAAIQMYTDGQPLWKITQETGVAQPRLHAELHVRNVPLRRPRNKE